MFHRHTVFDGAQQTDSHGRPRSVSLADGFVPVSGTEVVQHEHRSC